MREREPKKREVRIFPQNIEFQVYFSIVQHGSEVPFNYFKNEGIREAIKSLIDRGVLGERLDLEGNSTIFRLGKPEEKVPQARREERRRVV